MKIIVYPSQLSGMASAPASKSLTQRAIAAALLAKGTTVIRNVSFCNDASSALSIARSLGASIAAEDDTVTIERIEKSVSSLTLDCGESGLALRMFAPVALLFVPEVVLTGGGSLLKRPVHMIHQALTQFGVTVRSNNGYLPVSLAGRLSPAKATIDGSAGSQMLTGLLMSLPLLENDSDLIVHNLTSMPYVSLTLQLLNAFGISIINDDFRRFFIPGKQSYQAVDYTVEGDWSSAAFLLVAGAVAGELTVTNLNMESRQGDRAITDVLRNAGCRIDISGPGVKVTRSALHAFTFDASECPDLFPPLAALAAHCRGTSMIAGVNRLTHKESNRGKTICDVMGSLGIRAEVQENILLVEGGAVNGGSVTSHNDHRIAMMAAVMALQGRGEVTISGAEAANKSFPGFFNMLASLGATINQLPDALSGSYLSSHEEDIR